MKRPCVFLVADGTMAQILNRFLSRGYFEDWLGCRTFGFDFQQDVVVDVRNGNTDGGYIVELMHYCGLIYPLTRTQSFFSIRISGDGSPLP